MKFDEKKKMITFKPRNDGEAKEYLLHISLKDEEGETSFYIL